MYESLIPVKKNLEDCEHILHDRLYEGEDPIDLDEFNKLEVIYKQINSILSSI